MVETNLRVFVVDDDAAVRKSLSWLLSSENMDVATYPSAEAFLEDNPNTAVGCVLIDVRMPGIGGLKLQDEMHARRIHLPTIIITGHGDVSMAVEAMKRGAWDFVEKPFGDEEIFQKVRQAIAHSKNTNSRKLEASTFASRFRALSPRELEVLQLVMTGAVSREIAVSLGISERTVAAHRANIMAKMKAKSVPHLVSMSVLANELT